MKKIFGRKKGKKLREGQTALMAELLPRLALDLSSGALSLEALGCDSQTELRLEIGFGAGERLTQNAQAHPKALFLGCEPFENGVAATLAKIQTEELENIRLHMGDARDLVAALPNASLACVEILYPDPWPKRRQRKRRIVSEEFLTLLGEKIRSGGELRFATDIDDYCAWTLARIAKSDAFVWRAETPADWLNPWPEWRSTRYERKARAEGRPSAYLTFARV